MLKNNKGITLIALVVTIIILIILAGVSINLILGENGIINKAQEAKLGTEIAKEKEILQLAMADIAMTNTGSLYFDQASLEKALKDNSGIDGITAEKAGELLYIVTFPESKRQYEVYADGSVVEGAAPKVVDSTPGEFEGTGTEENPYLIQSIEDLVALSNNVNAGESYEGKIFKLERDLNFASTNSYVDATSITYGNINENETTESLITELTTGAGFIPIGKYGTAFKGSIDGNGNTISNLYINSNNRTGVYATAFIGVVDKAVTIKNLLLTRININGGSSYTTGGIIGIAQNVNEGNINIENCQVTGKIDVTSSYGVGGVIGTIQSISSIKVNNCNSDVDINNGNYSGGIIGYASSTEKLEITNSYNTGNISGVSYIGGLCGSITGTGSTSILVIENCYNIGKITSSSSAGGLISWCDYFYGEQKITNCYNTGTITGKSSAAGIVKRINSNVIITSCYNTGAVKGDSYVAGIVAEYQAGMGTTGLEIEKSYNTGNITGTGSTGGIVGYYGNANGSVSKCYNTGKIIAKGSNIGGIMGNACKVISDCYNMGDIDAKNDNQSAVQNIGGICGSGSTFTISNCYNVGNITTNGTNIGGIAGNISNTVQNVYNLGNVTGEENVGSIGGSDTGCQYTKTYYLIGTVESGGDTEEGIEAKDKESILTLMNENLSSEIWEVEKNGEYPGLI